MLLIALPAGALAAQQSSTRPSAELLEFLGSFETDSGEWIDPIELLGEGFEEALEAMEEEQSTSDNSSQNDDQANESDAM